MIKPIIGIIGRPNNLNGKNIVSVMEKLRIAIVKNGGIPLLILPTQPIEYESIRPKDVNRLTILEKEDLIKEIDLCDGIVIPGGDKCYEYDDFIFEYMLRKDIPLLGICAGMQLIGRVTNKNKGMEHTLKKIENNIIHNKPDNNYAHEVIIKEGTLLSNIFNKTAIKVNSKHQYNLLDTDLIISAKSSDGIIEAIEYPNKRFILGVQWHPESMIEYDSDQNKIFERFIIECIKTQKEIKKGRNNL